MTKKKKTRYVYEGEYVAAVEVEILQDETGWSAYLSVNDAYKLDDVRDALRRRDFAAATLHGEVYRMVPVES